MGAAHGRLVFSVSSLVPVQNVRPLLPSDQAPPELLALLRVAALDDCGARACPMPVLFRALELMGEPLRSKARREAVMGVPTGKTDRTRRCRPPNEDEDGSCHRITLFLFGDVCLRRLYSIMSHFSLAA